MQLDQLQVELRPRPHWEAAELGQTLVRHHAAAIWWPWLWCTLPVFVFCNLLGWVVDKLWLAALLLWWLKPIFDRIPLFVLSRAVFGTTPSVRQTLSAQLRWGWKPMLGYLTWRRLGPVRALYLPIDLLEGGTNSEQRRAVVGSGMRGTAALLMLACANFEMVLLLSCYAVGALFVPMELMSETMRAAWALFTVHPPQWLQLLGNGLIWLASSMVEPFYIGAGFGLYLDSRTRIEAWDVEIAFRRLRARVIRSFGAMVCVCLCLFAFGFPVQAKSNDSLKMHECGGASSVGVIEEEQSKPDCLSDIFGEISDDPQLDAAVKRVWEDPLLSPSEKVTHWRPKQKAKPAKARSSDNPLSRLLGDALGIVSEYGLWGLVILVLVALIRTRAKWLQWLRRSHVEPVAASSSIQVQPHRDDEALPAQLLQSLRQLWAQGRHRRALALLYRASVDAMAVRTGAVLVPGATEAECLRTAKALHEEDRRAFSQMIRMWQYAAYAGRIPDGDEFEAMLQRLSVRFGWTA